MAKKPFNHYEQVPEIIGIKTNIKDFFWGFGQCKEPVSEDRFERCKIKVVLEVRSDSAVFDDIDTREYSHAFRHFKAAPEKGSVIFDQSIKQLRNLRYVLTIDGNTVKMVIGKSYLRFIRIKLMYVHPVSYILFDAVSQLLLKNGMTTLYCSAVCFPNGKTAVMMAPPNTGKSLCALNLRKNAGAEIIAEDMAVTDGVSLWGAGQTNLYRDYKDKSLMEFDPSSFRSKIDRIDTLVILQKSDDCRESTPQDFDKRLLLINHYSLGYYYSPCIRALGYFNKEISVEKSEKTEKSILRRIQENANCVMLENRDSMQFSCQLISVIES